MQTAAYVNNGYLKHVTEEDAKSLDIINIAFGTLSGNKLNFDKPHLIDEIDRIRRINPDIRIFLSIGGWGAGGFSTMAGSADGIREFTQSCIDTVREYHLGGIDLDWEYPTFHSAGIDADPSDKENFTALLASLRNALSEEFPDDYKMLTIAAGAGEYYVGAVQIEKITPLLDYISIMTYDMRGQNSPAGYHTALYQPENSRRVCSVDRAVKLFHDAGVPYEKIVIGAAFYSRKWTNIPDGGTNGLGQRCDDPEDKTSGLWGPGFGEISEKLENKNGYTLYRDEEANAPYLYNKEERIFLSYDDEISVRAKAEYAISKNLCGVMYWEHSCDHTRKLLRSLAEAAKGEK